MIWLLDSLIILRLDSSNPIFQFAFTINFVVFFLKIWNMWWFFLANESFCIVSYILLWHILWKHDLLIPCSCKVAVLLSSSSRNFFIYIANTLSHCTPILTYFSLSSMLTWSIFIWKFCIYPFFFFVMLMEAYLPTIT